MKTAYVMSGVPGSGKSTYAKANYNLPIISSDEIRLSLFGTLDSSVQTRDKHALVFAEMHKQARQAKTDIVIDSTNLSRKSRKFMYEQLKAHCDKVVIVQFIEPFAVVLERNNNRDISRVVPEAAIRDMYSSMQPPKVGVDCDDYKLITTTPFINTRVPIAEFVKCARDIGIYQAINKYVSPEYKLELHRIIESHETPYHLENIDTHINMCLQNTPNLHEDMVNLNLLVVAAFHDLGKSFVKNGGRYFGHENVSAMYLANIIASQQLEKFSPLVDTILYHMLAHQGISYRVLDSYKISNTVKKLLNEFVVIDEKSRIKGE